MSNTHCEFQPGPGVTCASCGKPARNPIHEAAPDVRTYEAKFTKADQADRFAARIAEPGWSATNIRHTPGRRVVLFDGPATSEYWMDMAETVGYFGSPPRGPVATLNGVRTPRSY